MTSWERMRLFRAFIRQIFADCFYRLGRETGEMKSYVVAVLAEHHDANDLRENLDGLRLVRHFKAREDERAEVERNHA